MTARKKKFGNAEFSRRLVNQLERDLLEFNDACLQISAKKVDQRLGVAIHELCAGIIHFIDHYRMTDTSIQDINNVPGRPKKHEEREYFRKQITEYQLIHLSKFPTLVSFQKKLDTDNIQRVACKMDELNIDVRTYSAWKMQWKNRTFDHLIQE